MICSNCNLENVSPDIRCDCRFEWQLNKCFSQKEHIEKLQKENELLKYELCKVLLCSCPSASKYEEIKSEIREMFVKLKEQA